MTQTLEKFHECNRKRFERTGLKRLKLVNGGLVEPFWSYAVYQCADWFFLARSARRDSITIDVTQSADVVSALKTDQDPHKANGVIDENWKSIYAYTHPRFHQLNELEGEEWKKVLHEAEELSGFIPFNSTGRYSTYLGVEIEKFCIIYGGSDNLEPS